MIIKNICDAELSGPSRHVVALGNFDGVHYAHTELIRKAKEIAFSLCKTAGDKILTAVFTFSDLKKPYITTTDEKLAVFERLGVDCVFLCPFDYVRNMSPEEFVRDILVSRLGCVHAVCGYNYRFGKNAQGDPDLLCKLAEKFSFACSIIGEIPNISSTRIRELISSGNIADANEIIGRPFTVSGKIIHGRGVGHTFGCPTLNVEIPEGKLLPMNGVYFTICKVGENLYPAITNVGICPTFENDKITCENHLIDVSCELYGEFAEVFFLAFRRNEMKFSSPEELYKTVNDDICAARDFHISRYQ